MSLNLILGRIQQLLHSSMRKTSRHRRDWLMPLMLLLCSNFVSIQMAEAREDWNSGWNTVTWDVSKGCIHYHVRYYQTHGGDGDGHCGAQPLNITQATTIQKTFKIKSGTSGSLDEHQNVPSTYTNYSTSGEEYEHYIDFDVPVS